jgi:ubiquinone/menaquinone biosynthesis C-methylase UbiE
MAQDQFTQFEHQGWERVADQYESAWSGLTRLFIPHLLDAVKVAKGDRLLDVACGPGYVAEAALVLGAEPIGVDFSAEMVRLAKDRNPKIEFREGDAQVLDFADGSFDVVVMNFGVLHLSKPEQSFAEAARVLRSGGRFGFTVWAGPEHSPGAKMVEESIMAFADTNVNLPKGPDYFGFGDREKCRKILSESGFDGGSMNFKTIIENWQVPTASHVFKAERDAGVRTAALLAAQTPQTLAAIQAQIEKSIQVFAAADGFALPFGAHVIAAQVAWCDTIYLAGNNPAIFSTKKECDER